MVVIKFGGTSVADAAAIRATADVVCRYRDEPGGVVVVLSATAGTTTALLEIARSAGSGEDFRPKLDEVLTRHRNLATELLGFDACVDELCRTCAEYAEAVALLGEWNQATLDGMAAFGELMSSAILHALLSSRKMPASLVDARSLIVTWGSNPADVHFGATDMACQRNLLPLLKTGHFVITQGFIAADLDGRTSTLGRGGSDYSAAIIGAAMRAREILIYTDVSGVYSADPRLVADARPLQRISSDQMRQMADYGAKVLHPETITPAVRASIPVRVLNTFEPDAPGTCITDRPGDAGQTLAVSLLRCVRLIYGEPELALHLAAQPQLHDRIMLMQRSSTRSVTAVHCADGETNHALELALMQHAHRDIESCIVTVTGCDSESPERMLHITEALTRGMQPRAKSLVIMQASLDCVAVVVEAAHAEACVQALHEVVTRPPDRV